MVSENSDLYRKHPEWAIQVPGKHPVHGRNQLVLDFANPEVVDHIYEQIAAVLRQGDINYVKWDMNRSLCDIYSGSMVWQGNVMYDYMLGVYDLLERLTQAFPDMLWEGCSGGGGRFYQVFSEIDPGKYESMESCVREINHRFMTNFDDITFSVAHRFLADNGYKFELPHFDVRGVKSDIDRLKDKYDQETAGSGSRSGYEKMRQR